jgi:hypothetical protein
LERGFYGFTRIFADDFLGDADTRRLNGFSQRERKIRLGGCHVRRMIYFSQQNQPAWADGMFLGPDYRLQGETGNSYSEGDFSPTFTRRGQGGGTVKPQFP